MTTNACAVSYSDMERMEMIVVEDTLSEKKGIRCAHVSHFHSHLHSMSWLM